MLYKPVKSSHISFHAKMSYETDPRSQHLEIVSSFLDYEGNNIIKLKYTWKCVYPTAYPDVQEIKSFEKIFYLTVDYHNERVFNPWVLAGDQ